MARLKIIVVGAGLGGLTFALCAHRQGFDVVVVEQARELGEVGAGVQISANGSRILHHLGLEQALEQVAFRPERGEVRHWQTGETLMTRPLGAVSVERFGFPYYHLHRADFHQILSAAVRSHGIAIHLNSRVERVVQNDQHALVVTSSGDKFSADIIVGCDGIHSQVRHELFGADQPDFTGVTAWRATIDVNRLPPNHVRPVASNWIGMGGHFVHYYLRAGKLVNCVGALEQDEWHAESWSQQGKVEDFRRDFASWHNDLRILIDQVDSCFRWGLFDRPPMPTWRVERATLLGDACHPMLPFMAQGAVMAIEDAAVLARCLAVAARDPRDSLAHYEQLRLERTARVQQMSRSNMEFFHNPEHPDLIERLTGHRDAHLWLYGYDALTVPVA